MIVQESECACYQLYQTSLSLPREIPSQCSATYCGTPGNAVNPRQFPKRSTFVILCFLKEEKAEEESVIAPATVARIARLSDTVSLVVSFDSLGS